MDVLPESAQELGRSELESAAECASTLEDLIEVSAKRLIRIVQCCENRTAVSAACLALARFAATNESCAKLLERNIADVVATLIPNRPTIKHNMTSAEKDKLMKGDAQQMTRLPPSFFRLVTSLARLPDGQNSIQAAGVIKRAVERMTMGDGSPHDVAVKTEIALLLARMANKFSVEFGSTTELILTPKFGIFATLLGMLAPGHTRRTRFSAASALHALCKDAMRGVPAFVASNGAPIMLAIVREDGVVHPLLREALETIKLVTEYPGGTHCSTLLENGALVALQRIASDLTLEEPYTEVLDRYGLSDAARDCLISLDEFDSQTVAKMNSAEQHHEVTTSATEGGEEQVEASVVQADLASEMGERVADFDGSYMTVGVLQYGGLIPSADYEAATTEHTTPVGLMSAREKAFREELRRRKKYYDLDRANEAVANLEGSPTEKTEPSDDDNLHQEKLTHVPVMAMDAHPDIDRTVASLQQNPHLARTRPPRRPQPTEMEAVSPKPLDAGVSVPVPLVEQRRNQTVQPVVATAPSDKLMLDPCFGGAVITTPAEPLNSGEVSEIAVKQVGPYTFGAEQFKHSSTIFGHRVDITTHRVVMGRVSESGAHAETSTFKNVEESVSSMMASRAKTKRTGRSPYRPKR